MNESDLLGKMHELLLGALRSREQEVFRYLGILVPALGGFGWLLYRALNPTTEDHIDGGLFIAGTIGILLLLLLGAIYSLALGYNYRYITLELAKIENILGISWAMLRVWPKHPCAFLDYYYCHPPEVIKYFWLAFVGGIIFVTIAACSLKPDCSIQESVGLSGFLFALVSLLAPFFFGRKLTRAARREIEAWNDHEWEAKPATPESNPV